MEEYAIGLTRKNVTASDVVGLCIKTELGLQNGRKPLPKEIADTIIVSGYAEIRKF
jgi:hypothetical protein